MIKIVGRGDLKGSSDIGAIIDPKALQAASELKDRPRSLLVFSVDTLDYAGTLPAIIILGSNGPDERLLPRGHLRVELICPKMGLYKTISQSSGVLSTFVVSIPSGYDTVKVTIGDDIQGITYFDFNIDTASKQDFGTIKVQGKTSNIIITLERNRDSLRTLSLAGVKFLQRPIVYQRLPPPVDTTERGCANAL